MEQLSKMSQSKLKTYKTGLTKEIQGLKDKGESLSDEEKARLKELELCIMDVDDAILANDTKKDEPAAYKVPNGSENMIHLSIVQGRKFNPMTGKEESVEHIQMFSYGEWQLFKNNYTNLGYSIMSVLHDPFGEAEQYVTKK